jgi:hypothetical protein
MTVLHVKGRVVVVNLSFGKHQAYYAVKTPNLRPTYLTTKPFDPTLLLDISVYFCRLMMNRGSDRRTGSTTIKLSRSRPWRCSGLLWKIWELLEDNNRNKENAQETRRFYLVIRPMPTPHCGDLLRSRVALNPSQVIQRSNLSIMLFFLISNLLCEEFQQVGVSHALHKWFQSKHKSKEGVKTHTRVQEQQHHTHKQRREHKNQNDRFSLKKTLNSL